MKKAIKAPLHGFVLAATTDAQKDTVMDFMKEINGRSRAHVISYFSEFESIAKMAEGYLDHAKVSKKDRIGCTASYSDAGPDSKSYDYAMTVNHVQLRRYAEGWRLMSASKIEVRHGHHGGINVRIPGRYIEALKAYAIKEAINGLLPLPTSHKRKPEAATEIDLGPVTVNGCFDPTADLVAPQFDHFTSRDTGPHLMAHHVLRTSQAGETDHD